MSLFYKIGYALCWVVVFIGSYGFCVASYGFLVGGGLGWMPAGIFATIVSFAWPVVFFLIYKLFTS